MWKRITRLFKCDLRLGWKTKLLLGLIPFALALWAYVDKSAEKKAENPRDKSMPSLVEIGQGMQKAVTKEEKGRSVLLQNALASGARVGVAFAIIGTGVLIGLWMGCFPIVDAFLYLWTIVIKFFIPATLISVLFGFVGAGEVARITLMVLSLMPLLVLEARKCARAIPRDDLDITRSLCGTELEFAHSVVLPRIWPAMKDFLRLNLHVVITLMIMGEGFFCKWGLGKEILMNMRNINMADVIPYVLMIAGSLWVADWLFTLWIKRHRWLHGVTPS